jgi:P pilus assembly chaperone PapD
MRHAILFRQFALGCLLAAAAGQACANLMLFPTRIVFDKNQRAAMVQLINNGTETATYRISLVNQRMSEAGELGVIDAPAPGELFADKLLQYSPRQVTLEPGVAQTVRIVVRKPADLADGEYRSHLKFDRVLAASGGSNVEEAGKDAADIGVSIQIALGASMPVIVRHGAAAASVALSQLALESPPGAQATMLALQFSRSGNASVYGDLVVSFTPRGGVEREVGKVGGIAVYAPNPTRKTQVRLHPPEGGRFEHGTLRAVYRMRPDAGGGVLAQAELALP